MVDSEIRWSSYVTRNILGFSEVSVKVFTEHQANSICKNLKIPLMYEEVPIHSNPLEQLLQMHIKGGSMETKTLFFEGNVADYEKGGPKMDLSDF